MLRYMPTVLFLSCFFINSSAYAVESADSLGTVAINADSSDTEMLAEQLRQLRGELEKTQYEVTSLKEQLARFSADTDLRFKDMGKQQTNTHSTQKEKDESNDNEADATTHPDSDPEGHYNKSYELLKEKKYALAAKGFQSFLKNNPDHSLASSAYYWLGEIKAADKQYDQAAVEYMRGYKKNPKGNRAPDNLLKLAISLGKINKHREACISLFKVKKEFPNCSAVIKKSLAEQLKHLSCE